MYDIQFGRSPASVDYGTRKQDMRNDLVNRMIGGQRKRRPGVDPAFGQGQDVERSIMPVGPGPEWATLNPGFPMPSGPGRGSVPPIGPGIDDVIGGVVGGGGGMLGPPTESYGHQGNGDQLRQLMRTDFGGGGRPGLDPMVMLQILRMIGQKRGMGPARR